MIGIMKLHVNRTSLYRSRGSKLSIRTHQTNFVLKRETGKKTGRQRKPFLEGKDPHGPSAKEEKCT